MKKSVLITGASSGIGKATALYLDKLGYKVFAGVRRDADAIDLLKDHSDTINPVFLDVTDIDTILKAKEKINNEDSGKLDVLINNAGVSFNSPLEMMQQEKIKMLIDVNLTGLLSVTKEFIPLLRKTKGRIINISSGHGLLAIPDKSVYAASKFAVNAVTDSLRIELWPFGIKTTSIIVGKIESKAMDKIIEERENIIGNSDQEVFSLYKDLFEYFDKEVRKIQGLDPIEVSKIIEQSISDKKPKNKYFIGPGALKMKKLAGLPVWLKEFALRKALYGNSNVKKSMN